MFHKSKLDAWLNSIIEAGWLAALVVAPLFFNVFSSRVFEPDKISLIRTIALLMLAAWLTRVANSGQLWLPTDTGGNPEAADVPATNVNSKDRADDLSWWTRFIRTPLLLSILFLIVAYTISTILSVAPHISWWGSYQRLQGTYSLLSYIVISLLAMAHLRQPEQIRRIQHAVILTSLPIAIYGVIQHYGIDPLPWGGDVQTRIAANAGNTIFLAAYLIMAFFFTLERVYSSFAHLLSHNPEVDDDRQDIPTALAGGCYLFTLMVQSLAIVWTQSRGPWLGWLLGIYLFVLLLFTALRPRRHKLWTSIWVTLGVSGALFLLALNTLPVFSGLKTVPNIGRLATLLESDAGTGLVRVLIWEGTEDMVMPHEPLLNPEGGTDQWNVIRPLVGYGPEAMWIAYNPFYPPELAHVEARNASPDRAHNETWDSLVITGLIGFVAYLSLFIGIFYWALRWLGLLVNKRDTYLYGGLLFISSLVFVLVFYWYDSGLRFFGVALPAGMMLGLGAYVTLAAFLHPSLKIQPGDRARQLLIITLVATIAAHFTEIHFGIAIAATRTYFWIYTALLLALGMKWVMPGPYAVVTSAPLANVPDASRSDKNDSRSRRSRKNLPRSTSAVSSTQSLPFLATTIMTDLLVFFTFVFIYTTNARHVSNVVDILIGSITRRSVGGEFPRSPAVLFLLLFTWFVAATIGLAAESLQHRRSPTVQWWARGYALHGLIIGIGWLVYGLYEASRMVPSAAGTTLDSQLNQVAGHFAVYTWLLVTWLVIAALVYAWPWFKQQRMPVFGNGIAAAATGVVATIIALAIINSVNIGLVRADIVYKQGQQYDAQRNWVSSVELYRRALNARPAEDHYMLFLGRALLEQAKQAPPEGVWQLPEDATLAEVLELTPQHISNMSRLDLLRAAELVLLKAQDQNPLNTDHTANLARLYRTWSDLAEDEELRQAMRDKSIATYEMAVKLSPNAAHLWNEKANAHLAKGERELAEEALLHSLSLDQRYDQTYLLLFDFYERAGDYESAVEVLQQGIEHLPRSAQLYSSLGVAYARQNRLEEAAEMFLKVIELQPDNSGAMRNLALLYRDLGDMSASIDWAEQSLAATNPSDMNDFIVTAQLLASLYQTEGMSAEALQVYEQIVALNPTDVPSLEVLSNLYLSQQNWNKAVETLRRLMQLEPGKFEHPLAIAQVLQQQNQQADALAFAEQALELAPAEQRAVIEQFIASMSGT